MRPQDASIVSFLDTIRANYAVWFFCAPRESVHYNSLKRWMMALMVFFSRFVRSMHTTTIAV
jgi:hypothetical protein